MGKVSFVRNPLAELSRSNSLFGFSQASHAFPAILKRLGLEPFDFSKVIELFVKNTEKLPKFFRRHLFVVEEQIIESMAWEPGSSIYNLIRGAVAHEDPPSSPPPDMPRKNCDTCLQFRPIRLHIGQMPTARELHPCIKSWNPTIWHLILPLLCGMLAACMSVWELDLSTLKIHFNCCWGECSVPRNTAKFATTWCLFQWSLCSTICSFQRVWFVSSHTVSHIRLQDLYIAIKKRWSLWLLWV